MPEQTYEFYSKYARILNSGQSRSVILYGNIYDLFWNGSEYVPLVPFLLDKTKPAPLIQITYELNGPIRIADQDKQTLCEAWFNWKCGLAMDDLVLRNLRKDINAIDQGNKAPSEAERLIKEFNSTLLEAINQPTVALEFLRQLCIASRSTKSKLTKNLLIFIEGADMLLPAGNGDIAALNEGQLRRIAIVQDWFSEPGFVAGKDNVCMIAESRSLVHPRISKMPQIIGTEVPSPKLDGRQHYIDTFLKDSKADNPWTGSGTLASATAGLSLYALRQLLAGSIYTKETLQAKDVIGKVEEYIKGQVGDDVVEFSEPVQSLKDVVGASKVKNFIFQELIPRLKCGGKNALTGCAVSGAIGGGKTFIFEAVASELGMPVLVIKNLRSQWFGQTDVIFERLRRALEALEHVCIFLDEADTQFGGVGKDTHETERRLTGKIQAMMSDPKLKGKVVWILMTARIHLLSPDIRRPGRAGDLIIPILDPEGEDRIAFLKFVLSSYLDKNHALFGDLVTHLNSILSLDYSAAAFASLKSHFAAHVMPTINPLSLADAKEHMAALVEDLIPADIGLARRFQTLQAMLNCTRKSLLPDSVFKDASGAPRKLAEVRADWEREIKQLTLQGIQ